MKFKKIDNKTVCCMLSKEDLTDNNITLEDFLHNREKIQSFLEEIIETAKDEVGFEASGPMLSIQIMAMYPDGVMITFSEDPKDMANAIRNGIEQLRGEFGDDGWPEDIADMSEMEVEETEEIQESDSKAVEIEKLQTIFSYSDMEQLLVFIEKLPVWRGIISSLYKKTETGEYILVLEKGHISHENYRLVVSVAMEFGKIIGATGVKHAYLQEHCQTVIAEKAVLKLKRLVNDNLNKRSGEKK